MTTPLEGLQAAVRDLTDVQRREVSFYVLTPTQLDAIRADAMRRDLVRTPPPWGGRILTGEAFLGAPLLTREAGADISDVPGPVIDLRGVS